MVRDGGVLAIPFVAAPARVAQSADTIFACVNNSSGELKIVAAGATCHNHQTLISWGIVGPPGPAGPPGPPGATGAPGATNVQYVSQQGDAGTGFARAFCFTGTTVVGGGGFVFGGISNAISQSFPIDSTGANAFGSTAAGWQVATSNFNGTAVAFVICASP